MSPVETSVELSLVAVATFVLSLSPLPQLQPPSLEVWLTSLLAEADWSAEVQTTTFPLPDTSPPLASWEAHTSPLDRLTSMLPWPQPPSLEGWLSATISSSTGCTIRPVLTSREFTPPLPAKMSPV